MNDKDKILTLKTLLEHNERSDRSLKLHLISKHHTLKRPIEPNELNRPGLSLIGFYDAFAYRRIQIIGKGEYAYLRQLEKEKRIETIRPMFSYDIPCFMFSHKQHPPSYFIEMAGPNKIPLVVSELNTSDLIRLSRTLIESIVVPRVTMHGVMMEIFGMGVMITGDYGVGKSECALELIKRGHIFVADDIIEIRRMENYTLMASGSKVVLHHMEIQGIGIINVAHLFGVGAIRNEKHIDMIIRLEAYNRHKQYERIGLIHQIQDILGMEVPVVILPVKPGRSLPILVETATMNQRLKTSGYNTAKEFNKKIMKLIEDEKDIL